MLATVAALVIVLGLMVSLARYVRKQASDQLTKQLLVQLDGLMRQYQSRYQSVPQVPAFVPGIEGGQGNQTKPGAQTETRKGGREEIEKADIGVPPPIRPVAPSPFNLSATDEALPPESTLQENARLNNRAFVAVLQVEARRFPTEFSSMPQAFFEAGVLPDAWGTPIIFMPALHPAVGMAMKNRPFFLSAGPDRRFRTQEDNLYSYEETDEGGVGNPE